jgi:YD repeat-containing protein
MLLAALVSTGDRPVAPAAGQLDYPTTTIIDYAYDPLGRLKSATYNSGEVFAYTELALSVLCEGMQWAIG